MALALLKDDRFEHWNDAEQQFSFCQVVPVDDDSQLCTEKSQEITKINVHQILVKYFFGEFSK